MFTYRNIKWILLFLFSILFQSIIVDNLLSIKGIRPDFVIITLVFFGLEFGSVYAIIAGFLVGLMQGLGFFGSGFIGLSSLANSMTGFYVGFFQKSNRKFNHLFFLIILLSSCLIHDFLYFYISTFGSEIIIISMIIKTVLPTSLYTMIVGMLFFYAIKK